MSLIDLALSCAVDAHRDQTDKAGRPYILHPLRLMARMPDDTTRAVALLHDVIEDSPLTADDLYALGLPEEVVEAVVCLSRCGGESYSAFIERVATNPLARQVKLADIEDNMNLLRLETLTDEDLRRVEDYHRAWHRLGSFA